jgi:hypothetical protein
VALEEDSLAQLDRSKCGVLVGTAMGGMATFSTAVEDLTLKVCPRHPGFCRVGLSTKGAQWCQYGQGFQVHKNPFCMPYAITKHAGPRW